MVTFVVNKNGYQIFDRMLDKVYNCSSAKNLVDVLELLGIEKSEVKLAIKELEKLGNTKAVFGIDCTFICTK